MTRRVLVRTLFGGGLVVVLAVLAADAGFGQAAQPPAQGAKVAAPTPAQLPNFVGTSYNMEPTGLNVLRRRFEAGARTSWHAHKGQFLLFVEEGAARVQIKGQPMRELKKGETHLTPAGVTHWHGATANEAFTQVGLAFADGITFGEAVTDDEFNGRR